MAFRWDGTKVKALKGDYLGLCFHVFRRQGICAMVPMPGYKSILQDFSSAGCRSQGKTEYRSLCFNIFRRQGP